MNVKQKRLQRLVFSAMFCAVVFTATWISVPAPGIGNVNLGDAAILLASWMLGGPWAAIASGLGAALADLVSGYAVYAPATFVIKALMVVAAVCIGRLGKKNQKAKALFRVFGAIAAELVMITGYFLYESLVIGIGWAAIASVPFNAAQGAIGIVLAMAAYALLRRAGLSGEPRE